MTTPKIETFGHRFTKARRLRVMDIAFISHLTGISVERLLAYETGINLPSHKTLTAIAQALDISVDYLAGVNDEPRQLEKSAGYRTSLFSDRMQVEREVRGMTQPQMAELLGVRRERVSSWERKESPRYEQLLEVAKRLNVSLDWLCGFSSKARYEP
jgi:transcriptional regulator with XRE-family HTH domain